MLQHTYIVTALDEGLLHTVKCRNNVVQFIMILHMALRWQQQNINHNSNPQQTRHTSPSWASYGVSIKHLSCLFSHNLIPSFPIILKICTEAGRDPAVLSEMYKTIRQLKCVLWTSEISQHLSLWWDLEGYTIALPAFCSGHKSLA